MSCLPCTLRDSLPLDVVLPHAVPRHAVPRTTVSRNTRYLTTVTGTRVPGGATQLADEGGWPSQLHWLDRHLPIVLLGAAAIGVALAFVITKAR